MPGACCPVKFCPVKFCLVPGCLVPDSPVPGCPVKSSPVTGCPVPGGCLVPGEVMTDSQWTKTKGLRTHTVATSMGLTPAVYIPVGWCSHLKESCRQTHLIRHHVFSYLVSSFSWCIFLQSKYASFLQEPIFFLTRDYRWKKSTTRNKKNMINNLDGYPTTL